jgi:integrase
LKPTPLEPLSTLLCLATGIRTEEARTLRWEHVHFGDPAARPPAPASAAVWRSVRAHGDTKTEKSRRTLGLPQMAVNALRTHKMRQAEEWLAVGGQLSDHDLVFSAPPGRVVRWTRLTSGENSKPSARPRRSERTGHPGSCVIRLCR